MVDRSLLSKCLLVKLLAQLCDGRYLPKISPGRDYMNYAVDEWLNYYSNETVCFFLKCVPWTP